MTNDEALKTKLQKTGLILRKFLRILTGIIILFSVLFIFYLILFAPDIFEGMENYY